MKKVAMCLVLVLACVAAYADTPNHDGEEYRKYGKFVGEQAGGYAGRAIGESTGMPGAGFVGEKVGEYVGGEFVGHYAERYGNASDSERREMESDALGAVAESVAPETVSALKDASDYSEGKISTFDYAVKTLGRTVVDPPTTVPQPSLGPIIQFLWKWW